MPLRDDLLEPIPGQQPSGANLYYSPVYDQIREARRQDDQGPAGLWERDRKSADYALAVRLASDALATKTKDLQIAAWLTEALTWESGFVGLREGLDLIRGLIERFWDTLYPEIEDGDAEFRASPLEWLGNYLEPSKGSSPALAVRFIPLTANGLGWSQYQESRTVGYEKDAGGSDAQQARRQAIEDGKTAPEDFDAAVESTPKAFYKALVESIQNCLDSLAALSALCDEKFGRAAPGFSTLRSALEEIHNTARVFLKRKLELEPEAALAPSRAAASLESVAAGGGAAAAPALVPDLDPAADLVGLEPASFEEARRRLVAVARYLRAHQPEHPAAYLLLRALRWGELRAAGEELNPDLLLPPSTEVRTRIRTLAAQSRWAELLEAAETAMATECGRAWLDLHRYAITALEQLGRAAAARALKSELGCLLRDYPKLTAMTLTDDTGTANPDTLAWISEVLPRSD